MPVNGRPELRLPRPDLRAKLDVMPGSNVPVIRQPFEQGDMLPFWAYGGLVDQNLLYDRHRDPAQVRNLASRGNEPMSDLEIDLIGKLRSALESIEAPDDFLVRLGLS